MRRKKRQASTDDTASGDGRRKKRNTSSDDTASGDGDLSSKPRPSCTPPAGKDYEVFLSFRGEETRKNFTDHLYNRLYDAGVWVFRDNEGLHVGEEIGPQLMKAIDASKISIPIISPDYASSEWCLRELVQILECKNSGQIVLPIFYKVTPSSVRNQTGKFKKAFLSHQKKYDSNDVQRWRKALEEVASMKGLESNKIADGHEGELIKIVLKKVLKKLKKVNLAVEDDLIGVQDHIDMIIKEVNPKASDKIQVLLIHGMGGIGKTTLAKLIYNHFSTQYDHRSFLWDVRERSSDSRGTVDLQKQLISNIFEKELAENITSIDDGIGIINEKLREKRVLILFDDVNHRDQLNALAQESNWFKVGSLLIVTSRNKDILENWDRKLTYELNELDSEKSFRLFCLLAFGREGALHSPLEEIAREIVSITKGLPLAIRVIGSLLFGKSIDGWKTTLLELKTQPNDDVMRILKISYDSLREEEKQIFLDIACFCFTAGIEKEILYYMWDARKFQTCRHVKNLISLSLIKIGDVGNLVMHDHLRDLGKRIVREESISYPEKRSRLWAEEDAWEVLHGKLGTEKIEAISLTSDDEKFKAYHLTSEHFKRMKRLRLLFLEGASLDGDFNNLLTNLRWLYWSKCSSGSMPINFHPQKLVILELYDVPITEHWSGWSQAELVEKLTVVKLEECRELTTTPDFSEFKKLEILILHECSRLTKIHPNIQCVETLKILEVSNCRNLKELPEKMLSGLTSLERLQLRSLSCLETIDDLSRLKKLKEVELLDCDMLRCVEGIGQLTSLERLDLCNLPWLETIGDLSRLKKLEVVSLDNCNMLRCVEGIGQLTSLKILELEKLPWLKTICDLSHLKMLEEFKLHNCDMLRCVEGIGQLTSLKRLDLFILPRLETCVEGIGQLTSLKILDLFDLPRLKTIGDLSRLKKLEVVSLDTCNMLRCVEGIGQLTSLKILILLNLPRLKTIGDLSYLKKLEVLSLSYCGKLRCVEGIGQLTSLEKLNLYNLPRLKTIGDLSHLKKLEEVKLHDCDMLRCVEGIGQLTSLKILELKTLPCLETIGDLSQLKKLKWLVLSNREMLSGIKGISDTQVSIDVEEEE